MFLEATPPRDSTFALWRPDGQDLAVPFDRRRTLSVVALGPKGFRAITIETYEVSVQDMLPVLAQVWERPGDYHPGLVSWSLAARLALEQIVQRNVGTYQDTDGVISWRLGAQPKLTASFSPYARTGLLTGSADSEPPSAEELVSSFMDAVVDTMLTVGITAGLPSSPDAAVAVELRIVPAEGIPPSSGADATPIHADLVLQLRSLADPSLLLDADELLQAKPALAEWFGPDPLAEARATVADLNEPWPPLCRLLNSVEGYTIALAEVELNELLSSAVRRLRLSGIAVHLPAEWAASLTVRLDADEARPSATTVEQILRDFRWRLVLDGVPLTDDEMDQLAEARRPLVRLRERWILVDEQSLSRARRRVAVSLTPMDALSALLSGELVVDGESVPCLAAGSSLDQLRRLGRQDAELVPLPEPAGLHASLRDYQRRGLAWLADRCGLSLGACLADDMGLGKTITLIALHLQLRSQLADPGPTLVVCPAAVVDNWEREVRRFAPAVPVRRFHGPSRYLGGLRPDELVVTTYGLLSDRELGRTKWGLVAADEAQKIKNPRAKAATQIRALDSQVRVALTGTPVENRLQDLWAILDWTTPGLLGSRSSFRERFVDPIESSDDPAAAAAATDRLARLTGAFVLRRLKSDPRIAPELPPKTQTEHRVGLTRRQVTLYEAMRREGMDRIMRADEHLRPFEVMALVTKLKQICNHPAHYMGSGYPHVNQSRKLELLDELLEQAIGAGESVLVFSQYTAMLDLIGAYLRSRGMEFLRIDGSVPAPERARRADRFQDGEAPVFLLSLKAAGVGINLTRATQVIHYDRWWNPATEDQATDRAHRIGQSRPVQVHTFITRGTIEERIADLIQSKRALASSVIASGESMLARLTNAELDDLTLLREDVA
ncbi:DEAD/DEAH box helicase [Streptomyces sp. NBC_01351]|uniref:DEAD/DEAH box helicase n=1 Tax=Streptomyces sp. NBC_01351 TaxID=2903833 RepID=UPI002E307D4D|nr:DEAD/DEAH box helicase [Streptomyces sp. NBC_01351]